MGEKGIMNLTPLYPPLLARQGEGEGEEFGDGAAPPLATHSRSGEREGGFRSFRTPFFRGWG
jgi:hypothetical protein